MPFYTGLKEGGVCVINTGKPIPFTKDEQKGLEVNNTKVYNVPCTEIAKEVAKTDLATNMGMCGAIAAVHREKVCQESQTSRSKYENFVCNL